MDNVTVQEPQQDTEQQPEEQVQIKQPVSEPVEKKPGKIQRLFAFINRGPLTLLYPFVLGLVLLGGWWLINHPQFVIDNVVNKPNALYTVLASIGGVLVFWVVIKFFQAIALWTTTTWKAIMASRKEDPIAWFFWVTIYGLLSVSVLGSGAFFENHFPHPIPGVGYAIALMFDLVTINAMRARLEALRTGDRSVSWLYLLAIFICTSATIFGNVYSALDHVNRVPQQMKDVSPWLAIIFPSMIIVMSVLADHLLEKTSTRLDAATYRAREEQRLDILVARREMRERMKAEEEKLAKLDMKPKKERRTFFLVRWFFPRDVDMDTLKAQLAEEQKQTAKEQQEAMQKQLDTFFNNAQNAYNNLASLVEKQAQSIAQIDAQRDTDNALFVEQICLSEASLSQTLKAQFEDALKSAFSMEKETLHVYAKGALQTQESEAKAQEKAPLEEQRKSEKASASSQGNAENNQKDDERLQWVLQNYPIVSQWHATGAVSVTIDQIKEGTGHTPQKVHRHLNKGAFKRTRREGFYRVDSVIEWLKNEPLPRVESVSKEEVKERDNVTVIGAESIPETPTLMAVENDPDTGEYEAIMKGEFEELSA